MIDHLELSVSDVARSAAFYEAALAPLGYTVRSGGNLTGFGTDPVAADFWLREGGPSRPLPHVAFNCTTRDLVARCYEAAIAAGAGSLRAPGLIPQVHFAYFAAQVRDCDGHNIEFACHRAE